MYYGDGPGSLTGETQININGIDHALSDVFPIMGARQLGEDRLPPAESTQAERRLESWALL